MTAATHSNSLVIANAQLGRRRVHVEISAGRICGFPGRIPQAATVINAEGGRLLPGLADHHIHLLATAASARSVDLGNCAARDLDTMTHAVRAAARHGAVRAIGLDDDGQTLLDAPALDAICDSVPVRIQYRTGSLWVLNSRALDAALSDVDFVPECFERSATGLTGRVWRGDDFLRVHRVAEPPSLDALGAELARFGITSVTDANPSTDPAQVEAIAAAAARLPQRLTLMSDCPYAARSGAWRPGPVKILLDDRALPTPVALEARIAAARREQRPVAIHCVTVAELVLALMALEAVGPVPGDRIEHAMLVPPALVTPLVNLGLTVVCQPAFIEARGDRYRRRLDANDLASLIPLATLVRAGVRVAAGSDAPHGPPNPWRAIKAATQRRTREGWELGPDECLSHEEALRLFLGDAADPCGLPRAIAAEADADLIVLKPNASIGEDDDPVAVTVIGGRVVHRAEGKPLAQDDGRGLQQCAHAMHGGLT